MDTRFILCESVRGGHPQLLQQGDSSRTEVMREKASLAPAPYPVNESSNGDEPLERKSRRLELGKGVATEADGSGASWTALVVSALAPLCDDPESETLGTMSDAELSQRIASMALQTLVMEVERERRERRRTGLYKKMSSKYHQYHAKHQAMSDIYHQVPEFQGFREGLKRQEDQLERRVEELKERDEELVRAIARNSELEALLKAKEDELELSQGVMAENADLQLKVASLTAELDTKAVEVDGLKGELNASADKLAAAISKTVSLEDALCLSRSELTGERENSGYQIARFEGRVRELEAELAALQGQMASLRSKEVSRRSQPSTSRPSAGQSSPHCVYEL
ncbi:uncharacterized protein [Nicotiana sylvestris]|uniref:uncharacterized protein n=1 Tax=Nicotiana sylvestris TaxID=4096 RepID=UPI00388C989C